MREAICGRRQIWTLNPGRAGLDVELEAALMTVAMTRSLRTVLSAACGFAMAYSVQAAMAQAPNVAAPASATAAAPQATVSSDIPNAYHLGASDKLRVIVFGEDSLSGEFTVSTSGVIALPLIGEVTVTGRTLADVRDEVQRRLSDGYLKSPRVSIEVLTYRSFYILGEVTKPGEYPYEADLTIEKAVAAAQGFTYRANKSKIVIRHNGEAGEQKVKADDPRPILPGDTIRVDERFF
jgi:protein involved in polysaccharide export with SLBB domain